MPHTKQFHLITTGGTIDSYYDPDSCSPLCFSDSVLPAYLHKHCHLPQESFLHTALCSKDSREINNQDRQAILKAVTGSPLSALVITHGSFSVFETARYLNAQQESFPNKTLILTGSLRPIDGFTYSDGLFNLGASVLASQQVAAGVYVCIDGHLYNPDDRDVWH